MSSWGHRRSARISELDAKEAQQTATQEKDNRSCEGVFSQDYDSKQSPSNQNRGKKKMKIKDIQDLTINIVEYQVPTARDNPSNEDHLTNTADQVALVSSTPTIPEKSKLELLLSLLQRRDSHGIFAKPVDPKEVEDYYENIKEPMDFGTMTAKLKEDRYTTLEEFEHDIFLVSSNAVLFNGSHTLYYRQARAIDELAKKLFHALKTDPENFEIEFSLTKVRRGRRPKGEAGVLNSNAFVKTASHDNASKGYKDKRKSIFSEAERRETYKPWGSFLNENESIVSTIYNSSKPLMQAIDRNGFGYEESLMQFAKDLGPTAQMVARRKLQRCLVEAPYYQNLNSNRPLQTPQYQVPATISAQNGPSWDATINPPWNFVGNYSGYHTSYGGKLDIGGTSSKEWTPIVNHRDIHGAFSGAMASAYPPMHSAMDSSLGNHPLQNRGKAVYQLPSPDPAKPGALCTGPDHFRGDLARTGPQWNGNSW